MQENHSNNLIASFDTAAQFMAVIASNLIGVISTGGDEEDVLSPSPPLITFLFVPVVSLPTDESRMFAGKC